MSILSINGQAMHFDAIKKLDKSELKAATQHAKKDGQDNVIFTLGKDTFIASSPRNLDLEPIKAAGAFSKGSPATMDGKAITITAVDDELLSPLDQVINQALAAHYHGHLDVAGEAFRQGISLSQTPDEAIHLAQVAHYRGHLDVASEAFRHGITLSQTPEAAIEVAQVAHYRGQGVVADEAFRHGLTLCQTADEATKLAHVAQNRGLESVAAEAFRKASELSR